MASKADEEAVALIPEGLATEQSPNCDEDDTTPVPETRLRRNDIDGLRAISVSLVFLFHMKASWCPGGFVGVDIFFVISGFVVCQSLLVRPPSESTIHFVLAFLARRAQRLLPASLFTTCFSALALAAVVPDYMTFDALTYLKVAASSLVGSANLWLYLTADSYLDPEKEGSSLSDPFLHLWSLGVEEQFYVIFPWLLLGGLGSRVARGACCVPSEGRLAGLLVVGGLISASLCWRWTGFDADGAFYLLPFRFWELSCGACLALLSQQPWFQKALESIWLSSLLQGLGTCLLVAALWILRTQDAAVTFPFPGALLPVSAAVALVAAGTATTCGLTCLLAMELPVYLGRLSYPIYLWHMPVLSMWFWVFMAGMLPSDYKQAALVCSPVLVLCLAAALHHCLEVPVQSLKWSPGHVLLASAGALVAAALWLHLVWSIRVSGDSSLLMIMGLAFLAPFLPWCSYSLPCLRSFHGRSLACVSLFILLLCAGVGFYELSHGKQGPPANVIPRALTTSTSRSPQSFSEGGSSNLSNTTTVALSEPYSLARAEDGSAPYSLVRAENGSAHDHAWDAAASTTTVTTTTVLTTTLPKGLPRACRCRCDPSALHAAPDCLSEGSPPCVDSDSNMVLYHLAHQCHRGEGDGNAVAPAQEVEACFGRDQRRADRMLFWLGDSKAFSLRPALERILDPDRFRSFTWNAGLEPDMLDNVLDALATVLQPGDVVGFHKVFCRLPRNDGCQPSDFGFLNWMFGTWGHHNIQAGFDRWYEGWLISLQKVVVSRGATLLLLPGDPIIGFAPSLPRYQMECRARVCTQLWARVLDMSSVQVLEYGDLFCDSENCFPHIPGTHIPLSADAYGHLSFAGAHYIAPFLCSRLQKLGLGWLLKGDH